MHGRRIYLAGLALGVIMTALVAAGTGRALDQTATPAKAPGASPEASDQVAYVASLVRTNLPTPIAEGSGSFIPHALLAPQQLDPTYQAVESDVVVWGTVIEVSPARWNSTDGLEWHGTSEADMPIVYTTFLVEPREVLKGTPAWGTPVAFRTLGGFFGDGDRMVGNTGEFANLSVGDEIVVMGVDHPFYGGVYDRPAYWSLVNATSIYRGNAKAGFRRLNASGGDMASLDLVSLEEARTIAAIGQAATE